MEHEEDCVDASQAIIKETQSNAAENGDAAHAAPNEIPEDSSPSPDLSDEQPEAHSTDKEAVAPTVNNTDLASGAYSDDELVVITCDAISKPCMPDVPKAVHSSDEKQHGGAAEPLRGEGSDTQQLITENAPSPTEASEAATAKESVIIRVDDDAGVLEMSHRTSYSAKSNEIHDTHSSGLMGAQTHVNENALMTKDTSTNLCNPRRESDFLKVKNTLEDERDFLEKVKDNIETVHVLEMHRRSVDVDLSSESTEDIGVTRRSGNKDFLKEAVGTPLKTVKHPIESLFQLCPPVAPKRGGGSARMRYREITEAVICSAWGKPPSTVRGRTPEVGYLPVLVSRPSTATPSKNQGNFCLRDSQEESSVSSEDAVEAPKQQDSPLVVCTAVSSQRLRNDVVEPELPEEAGDPSAAAAQTNSEKSSDSHNAESETSAEELQEKAPVKEEPTLRTPIVASVKFPKRPSTPSPLLPPDIVSSVKPDTESKKSDSTLPLLGTRKRSSLMEMGDGSGKTSGVSEPGFVPGATGSRAPVVLEPLNVKSRSHSSEMVSNVGVNGGVTHFRQPSNDVIYDHATKELMRERRSIEGVEEVLLDLRAAGIGAKEAQNEENITPEAAKQEYSTEALKEELRHLLRNQEQNEERIKELQSILGEAGENIS